MSGRFDLVTSPWATAGLVLCCQEVHLSMGSKPGWMLLLSTQPWSSVPFCSQRSTQAASSSSTSWKVSRTHHTWAKYEPDSLFFILLLVSDFQSTTLCSHVNYFSWSGKYICTTSFIFMPQEALMKWGTNFGTSLMFGIPPMLFCWSMRHLKPLVGTSAHLISSAPVTFWTYWRACTLSTLSWASKPSLSLADISLVFFFVLFIKW